MSTIQTIDNELPSTARPKINNNFSNLNADKVESTASSSVDSEVALYSGTGGKTIKRASGSGIAKLISGVLSLITAPSGALVGDTDVQTLTNKTLTLPVLTNGAINFNAPQGFLINGKLSVTVASNNITVAIKTIANGDPSATDPVYCRIGDTVRSITSALSVTKNAGTNWCNAGSAELATQEIDYFVYLGFNATDNVVIGFSRKPNARRYGDFSTTSTDERYCAISTIANATSTDYYEVIGRFAATLSASASYNWSVPTFTALNLINTPIRETRVLTWTPTITGYSANPTSTSYKYKLIGSTCFIHIREGSDGTSNATTRTYILPWKSHDYGFSRGYTAIQAKDNGGAQANGLARMSDASSNVLNMFKDFAESNWTASGSSRIAMCNFFYEIPT